MLPSIRTCVHKLDDWCDVLRRHVGRHLDGGCLPTPLLQFEKEVGAGVDNQPVDLDLGVAGGEAEGQVAVFLLGKETLQAVQHEDAPIVHTNRFVNPVQWTTKSKL